MRDIDSIDPVVQQEAREALDRETQYQRERDLSDFRWIMSDKRGRRFVWRLLTFARCFATTFHPESSKMQDFLEGRRSLGLALIADAHESCLNLYHQMEREHATNVRRDNAQR